MSVTNKRLTHSDRVFNFLKKQKQPVTAYEILDLLRSEGITAQSLQISKTGILFL